jgi:hypothetical protein
MCLFSYPSETCAHPECQQQYISLGYPVPTNSRLILGLTALLQSQHLALNNVLQQNSVLSQKIDDLAQALSKPVQKISTLPASCQFEEIFSNLASGKRYSHFIVLSSDLPERIYKEKGFSLQAHVEDEMGNRIRIQEGVMFNVALFSMENPPKLLKCNISGKKILRGTDEGMADGEGYVWFRNLVINEVTSHYPNDGFCFVVLCSSMPELKPLAIRGVMVRARKHKTSKPNSNIQE